MACVEKRALDPWKVTLRTFIDHATAVAADTDVAGPGCISFYFVRPTDALIIGE